MTNVCPVCEEKYTDTARQRDIFHNWYTDGVEEVRVCPEESRVYVHLYERKHSIKFIMSDENGRRWVEVTESQEVRQR